MFPRSREDLHGKIRDGQIHGLLVLGVEALQAVAVHHEIDPVEAVRYGPGP